MERDSHRTLRAIHGSRENLVASIKDIQAKALVEVVDDDAPLNLRFITPYQLSTDWPTDENCSQYALTLPGELPPGQEYISVSYTWAHLQEIDASKPIPDYCIKDRATPDAPFRPINCPTMVFHRAWCFARARNIPYVWIDQECIYQENAEDKQRHLQIMDRIYKKSKWTVAVLSTEVPDAMLSALPLITIRDHEERPWDFHFENWPDGVDIRPLYDEFRKHAAKIMRSILSDRWFTRAWTFQERRCASTCVLLAPVGNKSDVAAQLPLDWIGNDVSFTFPHMSRLFLLHSTDFPSSTDDERFFLNSFLQEESDSIALAAYLLLFVTMERCDNLVCSDRLTIFANVCSFPYKLDSTILNDAKYSYSTCMMALMMVNEMILDKAPYGTRGIDISELNLDKPIVMALQELYVTGKADEFLANWLKRR
ncbi:hypothetical protein AA0117_g6318 [Alternaria alternata]|jgi:hypothetical protein|uniref:Heterokaryon incompatibility domain-containing protein n=1 Tax=Alternaria alternata TaxID=5599 RepID=A0A4V1WRP9_ALTAL|nr:hypothetical protein AA0117_g6318 [Alternaria alternata]